MRELPPAERRAAPVRLRWTEWAWVAGLAAWAVGLALLGAALAQRPDGLLHLWALDVGQGDALLIQTPQGGGLLIDGGPDPAALERELGRHRPFWDRGLNLLVLTHPHEDHITGLIDVLAHYQVASVLETPFQDGNRDLEDAWHGRLTLATVPVTAAQAGQVVQVEPGLALRVLYPPAHLLEGTHSDINNASVVLRLEYGTIRMLLTGDIETEAGRALLDAEPGDLSAQVLKVPHHGSGTGLSPELLAAIHPAVALISVGAKNPYGHPAANTLRLLHDAGVTTYRTDLQGTIELLSDGRQVWARPEHP